MAAAAVAAAAAAVDVVMGLIGMAEAVEEEQDSEEEVSATGAEVAGADTEEGKAMVTEDMSELEIEGKGVQGK